MNNIYPVPESFRQNALIDQQEYEQIYQESVENSEQFWSDTAKRLDWIRFPP